MDAHEPPPPPPLYTRRTHPHPPPPPPHSRELVGYGFFMSHPETAPQCFRDPDHSNMHILFNIEGGVSVLFYSLVPDLQWFTY